MFHKHKWKLIETTQTEPRDGIKGVKTISEHMAERLFFGLTTFVFQCSDPLCCEIKKEECLGQIIKQ